MNNFYNDFILILTRVSSIKKRNQNMSTSVSIVALGLTEAILRVQAYTFKNALRRGRNKGKTIGNVQILCSKKWP